MNPCGAVMKRLGNVWDVVISIENLRAAFKKAAKGRNYLHQVRRIKRNPDKYLYRIQSMLRDGTYEVRGYRSKTIYEPKKRTIHALPFYPHRIIHHAVMNVLAPYWESIFIYDSYACRTGKGQHAGSRRCAQFVRRNKYVLKCDVSKFYHSIPHIGLKAVLRKKLKDKKLLQLLDIMIDSSALCEGLSSDRGVNIGSLPSQWFGNLYMHELDTYVKHVLGVKDYLRYCDDFVLFSDDKEQLKVWKVAVQNFVNDRLGLTLSKCNLFPSTHGVDFLGYRHFKGYVLLRKSTSKRIAHRMKSIRKQLNNGVAITKHHVGQVASALGWLRWANVYRYKLSIDIQNLWGCIRYEYSKVQRFLGRKPEFGW